MAPSYLLDHLPEITAPNVSLRRNIIRAPISRTERYDNSFFPFCINNWNNIDDTIKSLPSLNEFKNKFVNLSDLRKAVSIIYVIVTALNY